jgi:hypothetical protein
MSFLRHARSIGPMWVLTSRKAQPGCPLPLVGTGNRYKGATEIAPLLIVRDESHRLSLGGLLSSRARLRFAGCVQFAMKEYGRSRNFQRTANSVLTVCVSSGDKRSQHLCEELRSLGEQLRHTERSAGQYVNTLFEIDFSVFGVSRKE